MTEVVSGSGGVVGGKHSSLTVTIALRIAWVCWIFLGIIPFFLFLALVWHLADRSASQAGGQSMAWFLGSAIYLVIAVPAAFFWRGHVFKSYWTGHPIEPRNYLSGMLTVWITLVIGGILSLTGCFLGGAPLPGIMQALVPLMFFVTLWPSGRSMVRSVGDREDPAVYEEPR